ncbi:transglutaminase-like domain-containing protein [Paenibacillus dokdonensis]|uniref:Transglutaminase-like domain-containing protein n=1 Tax=Paenibacillus dokdonensis TaxID=2567944 RepID=A0ABU6GMT2_9BACL|nr:transglutaminase-like domain-containing protein [Paenibacillus dokdonensis]MEC0240689.1 transglutaminase-like domain-containing protein [Paenibacillus dokdonensis]
MENGKDPLLYRIWISLPLMGLFMEWLIPLKPLNVMSVSMEWFGAMYVFTGLLLLLGVFCLRWALSLPIYGMFTLGVWAYVIRQSGEEFRFLSSLSLLWRDAGLLVSTGEFSMMSQESRMLVLMIGWALLVYSVQSLALLRSSVLLFAAATLLYLLCLETLLNLPVYGDIIRTSALILMLQGMVHLSRLRESGKSHAIPKSVYSIWGFSLAAAVLLLVAGGWAGGSLTQPKPTARISLQQAAERIADWVRTGYNGGEAEAVTGYNLSGAEEDMGLPLHQGNRIYFTAETPVATYWRGETFSEYNGRKWSEPDGDVKTGYAPGVITGQAENTAAGLKTITQQITFEQPLLQSFPLFGGGVVAEVLDLQLSPAGTALPAAIERNSEAGTVKVMLDRGQPQVEGYTVKVNIADADAKRLSSESGADPQPVQARYLQLPGELPQRVKNLADEITKSAVNRYEQVEAVKSYLKEHESYTLETRVPPEGQDFVDDFLFETHAGYCNHFSTAMTVLLRSEGIPARYVKGFAPGKQDLSQPGRYQVSEGDAHSWVEVYFPESGWVPFDPTPGFTLSSELSQPTSVLHQMSTAGSDVFLKISDLAVKGLFSTIDFIWSKKLILAAIVFLAGMLALMTVQLMPWLRFMPVWFRLHGTRQRFPGRDELLRSARPVWAALARRFGAMPTGITVREYVNALPVEKEDLRMLLYDFATDWERIAYDEGPMDRGRCIAYMRRCLRISKKVA